MTVAQINPLPPTKDPSTKMSGFDDEEKEHNLTEQWKEEGMTIFFVLGNLVATALWVIIAFVVKPTTVGMIGVVGLFTTFQWMPYLMVRTGIPPLPMAWVLTLTPRTWSRSANHVLSSQR